MIKRKFIFLLLTLIFSCSKEKREALNLFNFAEYIDPAVIKSFEEEFNIKVNYETYGENADMFAKFEKTKGYYDILGPSEYYASEMGKKGMLSPLDYSKIPNAKNLMSNLENLIDNNLKTYSLPYFWGLMGILYDKNKVDREDLKDGFGILFNPKYAGEIMMTESPKENIGIALLHLGYSLNESDDKKLKEAEELLKRQASLVVGYLSDLQGTASILSGDASIVLTYGGEAQKAILQERERLDFFVPEKTNIWIDTLTIPSDAPNKENAYKFINYLFDPEVAYKNWQYVQYSTPNSKTLEIIRENKIEEELLFIDERFYPKDISKFEQFLYIDDKLKQKHIEIWTKIIS